MCETNYAKPELPKQTLTMAEFNAFRREVRRIRYPNDHWFQLTPEFIDQLRRHTTSKLVMSACAKLEMNMQ